MKIIKWRILVVITFFCTMPVKRGSMMKNEVTPAPPQPHLTEIIGKTANFISPDETPTITDGNTDNADVAIQQKEKILHGNPPITSLKKRKITGLPKQPVCLYGFAEIFLFKMSNSTNEGRKQNFVLITPTENILPDLEVSNDTLSQEINDTEHHQLQEAIPEQVDAAEPDETKDIKLEVDSMQSFEEWKTLKLQQQEEKKAEKLLAPPIHVVRTKKTQMNYASQDCGAKILAHNKESKHVSAVLDENRDLYMLNPCAASIWFVIELCEPIQVQQLQLCNLELFSSAPKDFTVSISERYPAREWHSLATFHASNERNLQTFDPKSEDQMFAKYIKFEMLSHFSNEHFCPLTLVRVLGASMVDEFDETEQASTKEEEGVAEQQDVKEDGDGAINTMFNIVKNAVDHVLNNGAETKDSNLMDKDPKTNEDDNTQDNEITDPTAESEVILVMNETEIVAPNNSDERNRFITLVETGHGEDLSEYFNNFTHCSHRKIPLYMPKFFKLLSPLSDHINIQMCWFLEFFCKVSLAGCLVHYPYNHSCKGIFWTLSGYGSTLSSLNSESVPDYSSYDDVNKSIILASNVQMNSRVTNETNSSADTSKLNPELLEKNTENGELHQNSSTNSSVPILDELDSGQTEEQNTFDSDVINDKSSFPGSSSKSMNHIPEQPFATEVNEKKDTVNDDIDEIRLGHFESSHPKNTKTDDHLESKFSNTIHEIDDSQDETPGIQRNDDIPETPNVETIDATQQIAKQNVSESSTEVSTKVSSNEKQNVTLNSTNENSDNNSILENAQAPIIINPGTNQKDSVFMRLSNRIRVLEQNMSLSSDYLETLSQRYKKQMDGMQRAFNQTTSKLLSTSRTANENDARQTEAIQLAQAEIKMLTEQLQNLSLSHDQLNIQLVERHMCLILLEIIIFVAALVTCVGRRMTQLKTNVQRAENMIDELQHILKKYEQSPKLQRLNGQCNSIPCTPELKNSKRNKSHRPMWKAGKSFLLKTTNSNFKCKKSNLSTMGKVTMKGDQKFPIQDRGWRNRHVEVIDKDPRWSVNGRSCNDSVGWNVHPLAPKIHNGHGKGRK